MIVNSRPTYKKRNHKLGDLVLKRVHQSLWKRGGKSLDILLRWTEIVGDEWAGKCQPLRLIFRDKRNQSDGTLELKVQPYAILDVEYSKVQLIDRVNTALGYAGVRSLKIKQQTFDAPKSIPPRSHERDASRDSPKNDTEFDEFVVRNDLQGIETDLQRALAGFGMALEAKRKKPKPKG